jgi:hypothetical protein
MSGTARELGTSEIAFSRELSLKMETLWGAFRMMDKKSHP